jgi:hypothetical protein
MNVKLHKGSELKGRRGHFSLNKIAMQVPFLYNNIAIE